MARTSLLFVLSGTLIAGAWLRLEMGGLPLGRVLLMLALAFVPTFAVAVGARRVWVAVLTAAVTVAACMEVFHAPSHQCPPGWRARLLRPRARVFPGRLPQLLRHDAPVPPQRLPAHARGRAPRDLRVRARRGDPDRRPAADRRRRRPRRRRGVADDPRAGLAPAPRRRARSGRRAGGALPAPKRHASRAGSRAGVRGGARARRRRRGRLDVRLRRQGRVPDLAGLGSRTTSPTTPSASATSGTRTTSGSTSRRRRPRC